MTIDMEVQVVAALERIAESLAKIEDHLQAARAEEKARAFTPASDAAAPSRETVAPGNGSA